MRARQQQHQQHQQRRAEGCGHTTQSTAQTPRPSPARTYPSLRPLQQQHLPHDCKPFSGPPLTVEGYKSVIWSSVNAEAKSNRGRDRAAGFPGVGLRHEERSFSQLASPTSHRWVLPRVVQWGILRLRLPKDHGRTLRALVLAFFWLSASLEERQRTFQIGARADPWTDCMSSLEKRTPEREGSCTHRYGHSAAAPRPARTMQYGLYELN
ncbi:hypothetical protein HBI56_224500 [Parastagonospora nodorum]|nr:hypothetical protein HBH52_187540 [Parastagonospora nodorum]KAH4013415.1 hypothetical protein HBI09_218020 [Parastagonospora nodorum]KAH4045178.1 hypothetical protein HBH49_206580 [Parastagonospora nodorum]KAH4084922.1 hypothetical protein HBH46_210220 [Parastagonospora nodorum]KAH4181445.1 hypothetical protein HBH42_235680 [Parastagonospora nodorum]